MKNYTIFVILTIIGIGMSESFAMCAVNEDWPDAPCMDMIMNGQYPQEQVDRWSDYYDYKGEQFMDAKKAEMNQAIQDDILQEWVDESIQNYNVWTYYHFSGDAPSIPFYHTAGFELITRDKMPLQNLVSIHNPFWHNPQEWIVAGIIGSVIAISTIVIWRKRK